MVASNEVDVEVIVVRWWGATKAVAVPTKAAEASREQIFMVIEILRETGKVESGALAENLWILLTSQCIVHDKYLVRDGNKGYKTVAWITSSNERYEEECNCNL